MNTPHLLKLRAALANQKATADAAVIADAITAYEKWIAAMDALTSTGQQRVAAMVQLLNNYKNFIEVDLIMERGSAFLRRQKGQLKLDNSILEEFLIHLIRPEIITGLGNTKFLTGPHTAFMSLSFRPRGFGHLDKKPDVVLKSKDQDFVLGTRVHYQFSSNAQFSKPDTTSGDLVLAVIAAEIKVNLDKTMFQEAAGTATRLKHGCPVAKYFVLVEYLDMEAEDCRLTDIDNVYLLRRCKRLPFEKRSSLTEVRRQHQTCPIDSEVLWKFVQEIQAFPLCQDQ